MPADPHKAMLLLLDTWLNGTASDAEVRTLSAAIQADPEMANIAADRGWLHSKLQRMYNHPAPIALDVTRPRKNRWFPRVAVAAAILVVATAIFYLGRQSAPQTPQPIAINPAAPTKPMPKPVAPRQPKPSPAAFGTVATVVDSLHTEDFAKGEVLRPGDYVLEKGYLQLVLHDGTNLLFEAPAEFALHPTTSKISLNLGRVVSRATKGFAIHTPAAIVTDLGTEFGVYSAEDRSTETLVFEGSVTVSAAGKTKIKPQTLTINQARKISEDGKTITTIAANPEDYTTGRDLATLEKGGSERFARWWKLNQKLRRDPACVLFLPMTSLPKDGKLANEATPAGKKPAIASVDHLGGEFLRGRMNSTFTLAGEEDKSGL